MYLAQSLLYEAGVLSYSFSKVRQTESPVLLVLQVVMYESH